MALGSHHPINLTVATDWRRLLWVADLSDMDMKQALWELAFQVHDQDQTKDGDGSETTADISEGQLLKLCAPCIQSAAYWADSIVRIMKVRAG
ncbi:MAG: hypothetical protein R2873_16845 [Caldilineaceae bacterium]